MFSDLRYLSIDPNPMHSSKASIMIPIMGSHSLAHHERRFPFIFFRHDGIAAAHATYEVDIAVSRKWAPDRPQTCDWMQNVL